MPQARLMINLSRGILKQIQDDLSVSLRPSINPFLPFPREGITRASTFNLRYFQFPPSGGVLLVCARWQGGVSARCKFTCCITPSSPSRGKESHEAWAFKQGVMLSSVEAWWAGLCALPFDGAQDDSPLLCEVHKKRDACDASLHKIL